MIRPARIGRADRRPDAELVGSVQAAYERGQTVQALRTAEAFAPLNEWEGVSGCVLAARIAHNTEAPRLATRLTIRARRTDPTNPEAIAQFGYEILSRRGALALWQSLGDWCREPRGATAEQEAELLTLRSVAAAELRDFATAEGLLTRAESMDPGRAWIRLQRSHLLERLDRVEEALAAAEAARQLHPHPFYRPAVQSAAQLLQALDRDDDAIVLLSEANAVLQNGPVAAQLYSLLSENDRWEEAEAALERYVGLSPLAEPPLRDWVRSQRARVAYQRGRRGEAAELAAGLDNEFHKAFARRLGQPASAPERVRLGVTFVRQHFKTCAPATLAAIGQHWRMPADHLRLAEAMCYDGTPHWQQRQWAEQNGWHVREFRVTHDEAIALIERGVPFAISIVGAMEGHMMAVVGFDRARSTLLIRDPGQPYVLEMAAAEFLERNRAFGPHGMVFLPLAEKSRLEGLSLMDAEVYDGSHRFWVALTAHDRPGAAAVLADLQSRFAEHPVSWETRLHLAAYDANTQEQSACLDWLLERFPGNTARLLQRFACLREASRDERLKFLEQAHSAAAGDAAILMAQAREQEGDARTLPQAWNSLKRARRFRPLDPNAVSLEADLRWKEGRLEEATELYRFAANLDGFKEQLYQSWFLACRLTRRTEEALSHLHDRFQRFGHRSEQPALTLAWAWNEMDQPGRARDVLNEAARLRPDDAVLRLRSASLIASLGGKDESDQLLESARGRVRENDWLRTAAEIAELQQDAGATLRWAQEILRLEPLALDAHGGVARARAQLEGPAAALAHLKSACVQFPHHYGLQRMLVEWSRDGDPAAAEAAARDLLRLAPSDAWAHRELATALSRTRRHDEALAEALEGAAIEPRHSYSQSILGHIQLRRGQRAGARAQFRRAVELSVDNSDAVHALLNLATTDAERKEELAFVERQLIAQVVTGDGLLAFLELARPVLEPDTLLRDLKQAHAERPDLWHAWSALTSQLGHLGRLPEALELAREATRRFPHLPRVWLDLAAVHQWRNEPAEEIAAAERAFEISPASSASAATLAGACERSGRLGEAGRVYERALKHRPLDPQLHAGQAHLLWRQQLKEQAYAALERALRVAPGYEWAWGMLQGWAREDGRPGRAGDFARQLTGERSGEARVWLMLARVLAEPSDLTERLAAVERALALDASWTQAWDMKAELLAFADRFDEAIKACRAGALACTFDTYLLHGREAWVEARRHSWPEAIRLMRAVLAENTSYLWGWNQLAQWLIEQGSLTEAAEALELLLRQRPHDAWVNRNLGLLRLKQDDRAAAQALLRAAVRLEPTDVSAAHNLFELQLEANQLDAAAETVAIMRTHQPGATTQAATILLDLRRKNVTAAASTLAALCAAPDPDPWPVDAAANAFQRAARSAEAMKIFRRALKAGSCNPQVGVALIRSLSGSGRFLTAVRTFGRLPPGEPQNRAAAPLVIALAEHKRRWLLRWLLWWQRDALRAEDTAWAQVGYAFVSFNQPRAAVKWLADWRSRRNVEESTLFNLCVALRTSGRYDEAEAVAREALARRVRRGESADLQLFLAVEDSLHGALPAAQEHLQEADIRKDVAYDQDLHLLASVLVDFRQAPPAGRGRALAKVVERLNVRFSAWRMLNLMKDVRRTFRRTGQVVVQEGGGWRARLWFGWKLNWQWLLMPLAPIVVGTGLLPAIGVAVLMWSLVRAFRR